MIISARSGPMSAVTASPSTRRASMSRPESSSSRMESLGSSTHICRISLRFFSPPEKPSLRLRSRKEPSIFTRWIFDWM